MKFLLTYFDTSQKRMLVAREVKGDKTIVTLSTDKNFVSRKEILCRVVEADSEEDVRKYLDPGYEYYTVIPNRKFKAESSVYYDDKDKCYRSNWYGFAILDTAGRLRVQTPLQVSKDKTQAYFLICPTKFDKLPTLTDIDEELSINKIITPVDAPILKKNLDSIDPSEKKLSRLKVAQSKAPVHGQAEFYEPLIKLEKKAGKVELDGHIDYREVGTIHEVKKGTPVLKRIPKVIAVNGYTIYGEKAAADMLPAKGLLKGDNLIPSPSDPNIFVSAVNGCIQQQNRKLSVVEIAIISGDVGYESGNIDFSGTVQISGNVLPGFEVKAGGDVTISGNADDAHIESGGNITVQQGIAGKGNTKVICEGELFAKYIVNSKIESKGTITIDESIINSEVFSNDKVLVTSDHSKIMGGRVIARHRIEVNSIGSNKETFTEIMVGRNLEVERVLEAIRKEINDAREDVEEIVNKMKNSFGNQLFENPKEFISVLPAFKKKQCVQLLGELSNRKKIVQELRGKAVVVEKKLVLDEEPQIIVKNKVFPGTTITVRKEVKKILEEIVNVKFYYDNSDKSIRFTSAV